MNKTEIYVNKPIYVGFYVLELSKTLMYDFRSNYMLEKYGKNCKLMYTNTDSFIYHIKCEDLYGDIRTNIKKRIHLFDTSNYPLNNRFDIALVNNKVVGKMNDECCGRVTIE